MAPVAQWSAVGEDGQSTIPGGVAGLASPEELRGALESPARHGLLLLLSRQEPEGQQWGQQWTQWGSGTFCPPTVSPTSKTAGVHPCPRTSWPLRWTGPHHEQGAGLVWQGSTGQGFGAETPGLGGRPPGGGQGCGRKEGGASQWSTSFGSAGNPRGDWASGEGLGNN